MRYGDIFEIDGQLYEVTPVGYRPVSPTRDVSNQRKIDPPAGMLTGGVSKPSNSGDMSSNFAPEFEDTPEFINDLPGFAVSAYWQALSADERQYGESAEYVRQFFEFVEDLHDQISNAIASGETTIERGDLYQAYPDNPTFAEETNAFFDSLFGEDGTANIGDIAFNPAFQDALSSYNQLGSYYDFAASYGDLEGFGSYIDENG